MRLKQQSTSPYLAKSHNIPNQNENDLANKAITEEVIETNVNESLTHIE